MRKKLPKEIYVVWEDPGDGELYLQTAETISEFAERGAKKIVGTYKLVREDTVTAVTKISQRKVR